MNNLIKKLFVKKLKKFEDIINYPGALQAKMAGCYLNTYKFIYKLKKIGICPNTFIDVGANRGMLTKTVNHVFPNCKIFSFEPIKDCYMELKKLEKGIINLKSFNYALSDYDGSAEFNQSIYDYSSSLLKMTKKHENAFPFTKETTVYNVEVHPLEYFYDQIKLKPPVILKLDVQGSELKVMRGAGKMLNSFDYILCEMSFTELYAGQPLIKEVMDFMYENKFTLIDILELNKDSRNNELLQVDGLFVNNRDDKY